MFWRFSYSSSQIQTLLEKEDVTLQEILSEEDVLQECKSNNEKLIEFLTDSKHMETMLAYVIEPQEEDINEKTCFKNSTISCELLTCDIPAMNDAFFQNIELTDKLYSFLCREAPLNPLLASYFAKIIGSLILRKTDQFLDYIQSKEDFAGLFLKHINTSAVMDILLRFLTTIDNYENKKRVLDWLNRIQIIEKIIELFSHEYSSEVHSNAAQILCDIIRISREQIVKVSVNENDLFFTPEFSIDSNKDENIETIEDSKDESESDDSVKNIDKENQGMEEGENRTVEEESSEESTNNKTNENNNPLLNAIENSDNVNRLFDLIFESVGKQNCSLKDGVDVLLTLIDENTFYSHYQDMSSKMQDVDFKSLKGVDSVIQNSIKRSSYLHNFIKDFRPHVGFGSERLYVIKLITRLIDLNTVEFHQELIKLDTMTLLFDFMFEFTQNNFLHTQIMNIIKFIFNSLPTPTITEQDILTESPNTPTTTTPAVINSFEDLTPLLNHIIKNCHLIEKLVVAWNEYFNQIETKKKKTIFVILDI